jgi:hypothetical protein
MVLSLRFFAEGCMLWNMSKVKISSMTAKQFAAKMEINYRTALNWLDAGLVPGAERIVSPIGEYWQIPETSLKMERPKTGPKPKKKNLETVKSKEKQADQ